VRGPLYRRLAN